MSVPWEINLVRIAVMGIEVMGIEVMGIEVMGIEVMGDVLVPMAQQGAVLLNPQDSSDAPPGRRSRRLRPLAA